MTKSMRVAYSLRRHTKLGAGQAIRTRLPPVRASSGAARVWFLPFRTLTWSVDNDLLKVRIYPIH